MNDAITPNQSRYIANLAQQRQVPLTGSMITRVENALSNRPDDPFVSKREASAVIDYLLGLPFKATEQPRREKPADLLPGVYEVGEEVYVVRRTKDGERSYACKMVEIGGKRLTVLGEVIPVDFEYDRGAIFKIDPEHIMPLDRAETLTIRYGRCLVCTRHLKDAKSVKRGIGPVCIKTQRVALAQRKAAA